MTARPSFISPDEADDDLFGDELAEQRQPILPAAAQLPRIPAQSQQPRGASPTPHTSDTSYTSHTAQAPSTQAPQASMIDPVEALPRVLPQVQQAPQVREQHGQQYRQDEPGGNDRDREWSLTAVPAASTASHMKYQDEDNFGLHLLALGRIRGIGIHILRAFINRYGSLSQVWDTDAASLLKVLTDAKAKDAQVLVKVLLNGRARHLDGAAKELATLREKGVCILSARSDEFPERLRNTPSAPYWLFVQGAVSALKAPLVGIVGTRTPSQEGIHTAVGLAAIVAEEGFGIVSGLAEGIDHVAHRMGIYYRVPQVAVLGTGIEIVFPSGTARTRTQIIETGGAIVTEYLPQDSYNKARFVERDRIQAGLALALVPVESRAQSGTAHTLRFAEKYHRPIFGAQRGTPSPENELLFILRERGYPIFDIGVEEQVGRLVQWLRGKIADSEWPTHRYQLDREWLFRAVLQPLEDISKFVPLTDTHVRWLQERIARSAGLDTSGLRVDQPVNVMQDNRQVGDHETIAASETEAVGADSVDRAGWAAPSFASTAAQIEAETVAQAAQTKARKKRKDKSRSEKQASQPRQEREEGNSVESGGVTSADMAAEAAPTMERQAGLPLEDIPTNDGS